VLQTIDGTIDAFEKAICLFDGVAVKAQTERRSERIDEFVKIRRFCSIAERQNKE
jgi:hypothetical protein